jgi:hypothetical protein
MKFLLIPALMFSLSAFSQVGAGAAGAPAVGAGGGLGGAAAPGAVTGSTSGGMGGAASPGSVTGSNSGGLGGSYAPNNGLAAPGTFTTPTATNGYPSATVPLNSTSGSGTSVPGVDQTGSNVVPGAVNSSPNPLPSTNNSDTFGGAIRQSQQAAP